jgi:hypothetical protein
VAVGFFPLDRRLQLVRHAWTPDTIQKAVRLCAEIPFERAADCFEALTNVSISKSSLQRLVQEYGGQLVEMQAEEAAAMVKAPTKFDEETFRQVPEPDSPVMAVSLDGTTVNIRGEGWKEVKTATTSAVERVEVPVDHNKPGESSVKLTRHSYRAGLWDASTFAPQQWAEACRRGIEKAKQIVSVNDGARWIWIIVAMCYAPCVEIIDWWHAVEKLWIIAHLLFGEGNELGKAWVDVQKGYLWAGNLRPLFHYVHTHYPRGQALPEGLSQPLGYLFSNRHRMHYEQFRQAGYPVGSGSVESGCKEVVGARLKQAGMRWCRHGAQAMLALRSTLLSGRWNDTWSTLRMGAKVA